MKKHPFRWLFVLIVLVVGVRAAFVLDDDEDGATDEQLRVCREAITAVRDDRLGDEAVNIHVFRLSGCGEPISEQEYTSLLVETEPNTPYDNNPFNDDQPMEGD